MRAFFIASHEQGSGHGRPARNLALHARIGVSLDEDDGTSELAGEPGDLLKGRIDSWVIELAGDSIAELVPGRLIRIGRIG